jgi:hypothetical protein
LLVPRLTENARKFLHLCCLRRQDIECRQNLGAELPRIGRNPALESPRLAPKC